MDKFVTALWRLLGGLTAAMAVLSTAAAQPGATPQYPIFPYTWFISYVGESGYDHALIIDSHDNVHLLYQGPTDGVLRYVFNSWRYEEIADVDLSLPYLSFDLAVDTADTPCLVYATESEFVSQPRDTALHYGCRGEDGWQIAVIDDGGRQVRLAVGDNDQPHIVLIQNNAVIYLTYQDDRWWKDTVATDSAYMGSVWLLLDSTGRPRVVFGGSDGTFEAILGANGLWTKTPLDVTGFIVPQLDSQDRLWWAYVVTRDLGGHPPVYDSEIRLHRADSPFEDLIASRHDWRYTVAFVLKNDIPYLAFNAAADEIGYMGQNGEWWLDHPFEATSDGELNLAMPSYREPMITFVSANELHLAWRGVDALYQHLLYMPGIVGSP